jgi:hypothetical protein
VYKAVLDICGKQHLAVVATVKLSERKKQTPGKAVF